MTKASYRMRFSDATPSGNIGEKPALGGACQFNRPPRHQGETVAARFSVAAANSKSFSFAAASPAPEAYVAG
jgi:hypothetical protein